MIGAPQRSPIEPIDVESVLQMLEDWEAQIRAEPAFYQWLREADEIDTGNGTGEQASPISAPKLRGPRP
ncbi:hypothetical protein DA792_05595 [Celeribacter baekdonensis]|uniref:Uncharacterized protein n=1 Tax=Celeribacter baekdonensis TaxID=875171 RepID=A0A2R4M0K6_9RHOB|nr:hypothetical protein DA792_05595 [Celeribacter baekdonensis]